MVFDGYLRKKGRPSFFSSTAKFQDSMMKWYLVYDNTILPLINTILITDQFAFRKHRSAQLNRLTNTEYLSSALENGHQVNQVNHLSLIDKLENVGGIHGYFLKWIKT